MPAGFFGKVPCVGDFVKRRLAPDFVAAWDDWLQRGMHAGREQVGAGWHDLFLTSPVWRFAVDPGIAGSDAACGVMVPSMDRVGRLFPLTIALAVPQGRATGLITTATGWLAAAEAEAIAVVTGDVADLESFDARVAGLADTVSATSWEAPTAWQAGDGWFMPIDEQAGPSSAWQSLAISALGGGKPGVVFWTAGSDLVVPGVFVSESLPAGDHFRVLLDGVGAPVAVRQPDPELGV
ncbi:MAG: type VI secretion system-associated protein TagF [Gammaproteobacteria bacterium]|nr:type VI secretion system-associated protein TagF [Gammaproteobacteria bacterium]